MKVSKKRKRHSDISDSGALSDLAFLLIIFFIVVAVLNINKGFLMQLPRKDSTRVVNVDDLVRISLLTEERIMYDGEQISLDKLESLIEETIAAQPDMTLLLNVHPDVYYQQLVEVIDIVRRLHVENFSFKMMDG